MSLPGVFLSLPEVSSKDITLGMYGGGTHRDSKMWNNLWETSYNMGYLYIHCRLEHMN